MDEVGGSIIEQAVAGVLSPQHPGVLPAAIVVDFDADLKARVLSMPGGAGVGPPARPPLRVRKDGPVVVAADHPQAALLNVGYRWWLEGKAAGWTRAGTPPRSAPRSARCATWTPARTCWPR